MTEVKYAGFYIRLLADFVDSIILDLTCLFLILIYLGALYWWKIVIVAPSSTPPSSALDLVSSFGLQIALVFIRLGLSIPYYIFFTYKKGTTPGKYLFGIYIVSAPNYSLITLRQSWIRCFSYALSYLPLGCGFLMIAFQPKKQGLHDLVAGTFAVIKKSPSKTSEELVLNPQGSLSTGEMTASQSPLPRIQSTPVSIVASLLILLSSTFFYAPVSLAMDATQLTGSLVSLNPSLWGGEVGGSFLIHPLEDRGLLVGPHLGFAAAAGSQGTRYDILVGGEGTLWILNAIGVGTSFDAVPFSSSHSESTGETIHPSIHLRLNPFLAVRFLRYQNEGAWAIRLGLTYDTVFQWGGQIGVSLQFTRVPDRTSHYN